MPTFERRNLEIDEISICKLGANEGAKIFFFKSEDKEQLMDIKIEDEKLKKEVEVLIKGLEDKSTKLQEQFDELQKTHGELVKAQEKKEPIEKKIEKLPEDMQKAWDESQKLIKKAQEDAQAAKEEVASLRKEAVQKEISEIVDKMPRIAAGPEEHKALEDLLVKMNGEDRKTYIETLAKAEKVAGEAESMFKEIGRRGTAPQGDVADKVDALAKEHMAKSEDKITIEQARVYVREHNPDLRDEQETS